MPLAIEIVTGELTALDVDALVCPSNNSFSMEEGIAVAIKSAGGTTIEKDAQSKGPVMPGDVIATTAGKLPHKYIIHAAICGRDGRTSDKLIRRATVAALNLAVELGIGSLGMPPFGAHEGGFPMMACANLMTAAVRGYRPSGGRLEKVVFCVEDAYGLLAFQKAMTRPNRV